MTLALDQQTLVGAVAVISGVGVAIRFTIFHFRVLRILRELISRLPLALGDGIIREATEAEQPLTSKRGSQRFSCHYFVRKEAFNEQFDAAIDRYRQAIGYPLKSRVSVAAVALWFVFAVLLGVYFMGNQGASQGSAPINLTATNQPLSLNISNIQSTAQASQVPVSGTNLTLAAQPIRDKTAEALSNVTLVLLAISVGFTLFAVSLVVCYHYSVFGVLVEDVITLCDAVGLVAVKHTAGGNQEIHKIVQAKDDPEYNALLRLTKKA